MPERPDVMLITCEHGGHAVPPEYADLFKGQKTLLASHRGWDPGTLTLGRRLARRLHCPIVAAQVTRLLVDLNRSLHHRRAFSEISRALSREERSRIAHRYYWPHRDRVESAVFASLAKHRRVLHLGMHSFTPILDGEVRNADVALLYDPRRPREKAWASRFLNRLGLAMPGLRLRRNYPYRGTADGLTTTLRGKFPASRYLGIELEINQAIVRANKHWARLQSTIAQVLTQLR